MTHRRQALGREGERRAAHSLEARGYRIVDRNVRVDRVEIDLIAMRRREIVFVEVKTRRGRPGDHGLAAEAVDARKQARLRRGAGAWLRLNPRFRTYRIRFDVMTCVVLSADMASGSPPERGPQNDDTAPDRARWSIQTWESAF